MSDQDPEEWSSTRVAEHLATYRSTVLDIPRAALPYREIGRRKIRRYRPEDVRAYAAGQEAQPPEPGTIADHERRLADHEARLTALEQRSRGKLR